MCVPVGNMLRSLYVCPCREQVEVTVRVSVWKQVKNTGLYQYFSYSCHSMMFNCCDLFSITLFLCTCFMYFSFSQPINQPVLFSIQAYNNNVCKHDNQDKQSSNYFFPFMLARITVPFLSILLMNQ